MCGFAAMFALDGAPARLDIIESMNRAIRHRGPDDEGYFSDRHAAFGFRRLSILDLSAAGHQPMTSSDGRHTIVFNGEIYNYLEIREELVGRGHTFRSSGDTEVLLHAYREWGVDCLRRLNGMWAFLVFDAATGKLFGSRDRFGIKPLFVWRSKSVYLFGSEIKAIKASGFYQADVDWAVAARFLQYGSLDESSRTFCAGIESVAPGTWFELSPNGRETGGRYWLPPRAELADSRDIHSRYAELFEDAIRLHARSDVPVAVHLSGGLDSTSIICALARLRDESNADQKLCAFSYMAPEFDESAQIKDTVQRTGARLVRLEATPVGLWDTLNDAIWFHDEPVHSMTALVSYALMRETHRHGIKVVLNGQGADETLAGYPSYFTTFWQALMRESNFVSAAREIRSCAKANGAAFLPIFWRQAAFFVRAQLGAIKAYRRVSLARRNADLEQRSWYSAELLKHLKADTYRRYNQSLHEELCHSIFTSPLPLYLRIEDRNAMAWSVESRVPFLDHRLVEFALQADSRLLMSGPYNKYLLRQAMNGKIPESVRLRIDKMGFPTPSRKWFKDDLLEPLSDAIRSRKLREAGIFNVASVENDLARFHRGEAEFSEEMFRLAQFSIWLDTLKSGQHRSPGQASYLSAGDSLRRQPEVRSATN